MVVSNTSVCLTGPLLRKPKWAIQMPPSWTVGRLVSKDLAQHRVHDRTPTLRLSLRDSVIDATGTPLLPRKTQGMDSKTLQTSLVGQLIVHGAPAAEVKGDVLTCPTFITGRVNTQRGLFPQWDIKTNAVVVMVWTCRIQTSFFYPFFFFYLPECLGEAQ